MEVSGKRRRAKKARRRRDNLKKTLAMEARHALTGLNKDRKTMSV